MNDFIFNYIFNKEKDKSWLNANVFRGYVRRKYKIKDFAFGTRIYTAINRYQVKRYGRSLQTNDVRTREEYIRIGAKMRQIKYDRKRK